MSQAELEDKLQKAYVKRTKCEDDAATANILFMRKNALTRLTDIRQEIRTIEGELSDFKIRQGIQSAETKLAQFERELAIEREKCDRYEKTAAMAWRPDLAEQTLLLLNNIWLWIRDDIEARIADQKRILEIPQAQILSWQLEQLHKDLNATKDKLEKYDQTEEKAESENAAETARLLKKNATHEIKNIEARIADLKVRQNLLVPPTAPPENSTESNPLFHSQINSQSNSLSNTQLNAFLVFVSYCWANSAAAKGKNIGGCDPRALADRISVTGSEGSRWESWLDVHRLGAGLPLFDQLAAAISQSSFAVICASDEYANSDNSRKEFNFILTRKLPYVLVLVGPSSSNWSDHWLKLAVGDTFYVDARDDEGFISDIHYAQIIEAIERVFRNRNLLLQKSEANTESLTVEQSASVQSPNSNVTANPIGGSAKDFVAVAAEASTNNQSSDLYRE
ncbi:hypothetical protein HK100_004642 [Physocladia obscura]|uniref:TIR domain-containing protein n=1 Tax=Physocladia obscura TaxID=109957 RepID=A0AAD5SSV4_9FUNG|nr:hypothetical protein HK100_004642 [Physocladia obscura]